VRYLHMTSAITGRGTFVTLVWVVIIAILLMTVAAPALFVVFHGYVVIGFALWLVRRGKAPEARVRSPEAHR
jgi:hypothetical protein